MLFHRRISLLSLAVLAILTLSGAGGFAADCNVKNAEGNCLGQDCSNIGESTLDNDQTKVIVCLRSVKDGPLVWKSMSPNASQQNVECPGFNLPLMFTDDIVPGVKYNKYNHVKKNITIKQTAHGQSQMFGPIFAYGTETEGFALCSNGVTSIRVTRFEMMNDCSSAHLIYPTVNNAELGGLANEETRTASKGYCSPP